MRRKPGALSPRNCMSRGRDAAAREGWGFYELCGSMAEKRSAAVISLHLQNIIDHHLPPFIFFQAVLRSQAADWHPAAALCRRVANHSPSILLLPASPGEPHSSASLKLRPRPRKTSLPDFGAHCRAPLPHPSPPPAPSRGRAEPE